jgi:hypothetical protein
MPKQETDKSRWQAELNFDPEDGGPSPTTRCYSPEDRTLHLQFNSNRGVYNLKRKPPLPHTQIRYVLLYLHFFPAFSLFMPVFSYLFILAFLGYFPYFEKLKVGL